MLPKILVPQPDGSTLEETKPLELHVDPEKLSVGDMRLMKGYVSQQNADQSIALIGEFLLKHTNWTETEVNQISVTELGEVMEQIRTAEENQAVPLTNSSHAGLSPAATADPPNGS